MGTFIKDAICAVSSANGIYCPQVFAERYQYNVEDRHNRGISILLEGPDNEEYWEAWDDIEQTAYVYIDGEEYSIHQNYDVWLVPTNWEDRQQFLDNLYGM